MSRLSIDPVPACRRIERFLREQIAREPRRGGYVVGLSGGIDSALTAALCVRAVGADNVLGVFLPEKESQPISLELGQELAARLHIEGVLDDITPTLEQLGVYDRREAIVSQLFPDFGPGWSYRLRLPGDLRENEELNLYRLEVFPPGGEPMSKRMPLAAQRAMSAATNVKQRVRMLRLYEHAERNGYLVCGTTNRSETVQGFFVRHGDGGVDVEPLAHLYKTQVYALSRHLEIPRGILERPPSPDTYSAPVDDADFYFRLPYDVLDQLLASYEAGVDSSEAAAEAGLDESLAKRVYRELERRASATARLRELPPSLLEEASA